MDWGWGSTLEIEVSNCTLILDAEIHLNIIYHQRMVDFNQKVVKKNTKELSTVWKVESLLAKDPSGRPSIDSPRGSGHPPITPVSKWLQRVPARMARLPPRKRTRVSPMGQLQPPQVPNKMVRGLARSSTSTFSPVLSTISSAGICRDEWWSYWNSRMRTFW